MFHGLSILHIVRIEDDSILVLFIIRIETVCCDLCFCTAYIDKPTLFSSIGTLCPSHTRNHNPSDSLRFFKRCATISLDSRRRKLVLDNQFPHGHLRTHQFRFGMGFPNKPHEFGRIDGRYVVMRIKANASHFAQYQHTCRILAAAVRDVVTLAGFKSLQALLRNFHLVPDRAKKVFFNQYLLSPSFFYRFQVSFYRS